MVVLKTNLYQKKFESSGPIFLQIVTRGLCQNGANTNIKQKKKRRNNNTQNQINKQTNKGVNNYVVIH